MLYQQLFQLDGQPDDEVLWPFVFPLAGWGMTADHRLYACALTQELTRGTSIKVCLFLVVTILCLWCF